MRKGRQSKGKEIRPTFFVFCEGETEAAYVAFLRSVYRLPIELVVRKAGSGVNRRFIDNCKKDYTVHPKDKTFLIYDYDVPEIVEKLQKIAKIELLFSNPCFELWFLLHFQNQAAELTTEMCIQKLVKHFKEYKKGNFDHQLKFELFDNQDKAVARAKSLSKFANPSTNVYVLIEELEKVKNNN